MSHLIKGYGNPFWKPFPALSQCLIVTLLYHQLLRMLNCGNTKAGTVAMPSQTMRRIDTKMRWKANFICGTVQRTI